VYILNFLWKYNFFIWIIFNTFFVYFFVYLELDFFSINKALQFFVLEILYTSNLHYLYTQIELLKKLL